MNEPQSDPRDSIYWDGESGYYPVREIEEFYLYPDSVSLHYVPFAEEDWSMLGKLRNEIGLDLVNGAFKPFHDYMNSFKPVLNEDGETDYDRLVEMGIVPLSLANMRVFLEELDDKFLDALNRNRSITLSGENRAQTRRDVAYTLGMLDLLHACLQQLQIQRFLRVFMVPGWSYEDLSKHFDKQFETMDAVKNLYSSYFDQKNASIALPRMAYFTKTDLLSDYDTFPDQVENTLSAYKNIVDIILEDYIE